KFKLATRRRARGVVGSKQLQIHPQRHDPIWLVVIAARLHRLHDALSTGEPSRTPIQAISLELREGRRVLLGEILGGPENHRHISWSPECDLCTRQNEGLLPLVNQIKGSSEQLADSARVIKAMHEPRQSRIHGFNAAWLVRFGEKLHRAQIAPP